MLIAHLSDPHLRGRGELYQGLVDSNAMFDLAVDALNALDPAPDVVIIGGDLVDEGRPEEYETVRRTLARLSRPIFAIPGNHDAREPFRACFAGFAAADGPAHFDLDDDWPVRVLGLDVTVPGEHHGEADDAACGWLEARLAERPGKPTLVLMHQPPFEIGVAAIDAYRCFGAERLAAILSRHAQVERLLCGHVHRFAQTRFGGAPALTAPSTATAIALRLAPEAEPASFVEPPAFLLHHWRPGAGLVTHWVPVGRFPGPMPFF